MTNKEYLAAELGGFDIDEKGIALLLYKARLKEGDIADATKLKEAIYNTFPVMLTIAAKNVSEGGYSVSWNIDALKIYYSVLCRELGKPDLINNKPQPIVRNKSHIW